jgi:hypothetical protein
VGFAAGLTLLVAVLAGLLARLSLFPVFPGLHYALAESGSGPAPVVARIVLLFLYGTVAGCYVLLPVGVAGYHAVEGERHPLFYAVFATAAILSLPGLVFIANLSGPTTLALLLLAAATVVAVAVAFGIARRRGPDDPDDDVPWLVFANVGLVVVFLLGMVFGGIFVGGAASEVVERHRPGFIGLDVSYTAIDGNRGVLTTSHENGEPTPPDRIHIEGEGFAAVEDVDQTEPGPWQGETSSGPYDVDGPVVSMGDSVTVGVEEDCRVQLVYRHENASRLLAAYECAELRAEE